MDFRPPTRQHKRAPLLNILSAITFAALAFGAPAQSKSLAPLSFSAGYSIEYGGVEVADVDLEFTTENGLQLVTESTAKGIASLIKAGTQREVSSLQIIDDAIAGDSYTSTNIRTRRALKGKTRTIESRELEVKFDWENSTAAYVEDRKRTDVALKPGSLDRQALAVGLRYQLRKATATDPAARPPKFDYYFVDRKTLRSYKMVYQGDEEISTKQGTLNTAKYNYSTKSGKQTVMWLAEDKDWLPVRFDKIKPNKPTLSMTIK